MQHKHVTKLGRIIGTEEKVGLQALVAAVQSACRRETHFPELTDAELEKLCPFLAWKNLKVIKKSLENTTQLAKLENRLPMRRHNKSRSPQLNVPQLQEAYATDTMFASIKSFQG